MSYRSFHRSSHLLFNLLSILKLLIPNLVVLPMNYRETNFLNHWLEWVFASWIEAVSAIYFPITNRGAPKTQEVYLQSSAS